MQSIPEAVQLLFAIAWIGGAIVGVLVVSFLDGAGKIDPDRLFSWGVAAVLWPACLVVAIGFGPIYLLVRLFNSLGKRYSRCEESNA